MTGIACYLGSSMLELVQASLQEAEKGLKALLQNTATLQKIVSASEVMADCFRKEGHIYSCGNGGSMCDAMHFAEELSGRFRKDRPGLGAVAISDGAYLSCVANDFGYEHIFARYVAAHGRGGDVLLGISTSGKSPNVILAAKQARDRGMKVITLTGKPNSELGALADIDICTPVGTYADRVQELHIKVIHSFIELIEKQLFHMQG